LRTDTPTHSLQINHDTDRQLEFLTFGDFKFFEFRTKVKHQTAGLHSIAFFFTSSLLESDNACRFHVPRTREGTCTPNWNEGIYQMHYLLFYTPRLPWSALNDIIADMNQLMKSESIFHCQRA